MTTSSFRQNVYINHHDPISVEDVHEDSLSLEDLQLLQESVQDGIVGVGSMYRSDCSLSCLALATLTHALVIRFAAPPKISQKRKKNLEKQQPVCQGRVLLGHLILCNSDIQLYGYRIDRIAVALFLDLSFRINAAVDLLSVAPDRYDPRSPRALMDALGGESFLHKEKAKALFVCRENDAPLPDSVALQAWVACRAATLKHMAPRYATISRIATDTMPDLYLSILAKVARDAEVLEGKRSTIASEAGRTDQSSIKGTVKPPSGKILPVATFGRDALTSAEARREDVVRKALQGVVDLAEHPFFCSIWMPSFPIIWPPPPQGKETNSNPLIYYPLAGGTLNTTQDTVVKKIVSEADKDRVVLIQGPPGTGKTTVIAASVTSIMEYGDDKRTIWLVAQSNAAVRNIAEKLDKVGFHEFKLLVSKDFHFGGHEHFYKRLEHCVIRSDGFRDKTVSTDQLLLGTRVILCTLGMLSNLHIDEITQRVPLHTVVFDEANQIEVGDYLPLLHRFQSTLQKMVFIGDDKQLAPFGQDNIKQLQSVFELPHIQKKAYFLDTQYRMPVVIAEFISRHVYDNLVETDHNIDSALPCRFLDVKNSQEKKAGHSWVNEDEAAKVIKLARRYVKEGKEYRIITPYDAQRALIEKRLQWTKLPWSDKCFNVDSFQGDEEDHIIISLVRSDDIGFLKDVRRTNVMLTRCKKSMIICTSRQFVTSDKAAYTLVGKLAAVIGPDGWLNNV